MNKALEGQSRAADDEPLTSALRFSQSLAPTNIVTLAGGNTAVFYEPGELDRMRDEWER